MCTLMKTILCARFSIGVLCANLPPLKTAPNEYSTLNKIVTFKLKMRFFQLHPNDKTSFCLSGKVVRTFILSVFTRKFKLNSAAGSYQACDSIKRFVRAGYVCIEFGTLREILFLRWELQHFATNSRHLACRQIFPRLLKEPSIKYATPFIYFNVCMWSPSTITTHRSRS